MIGNCLAMRWFKRIRLEQDGINLAADLDVVVAVNRGRTGATNRVESNRHVSVVQDSRQRRDAGEQPQTDPKERR